MRAIKFLVLAIVLSVATFNCKKDEITSGPSAIEPHDFLAGDDYNRLIVEIAYIEGYQPSNNTVNNIINFLDARLNKPSGITVAYNSIPASGRSSWSAEDLRQMEKDHRDHYTKGNTLTTFVFFADAPFSGGSNTLGLAYGRTSVAVFEKTVHENSGGLFQPSRDVLETTVAEHEFGHLFGLVDNGTSMTSPHSDGGKHCNNEDCLMYYAVETTDILASLLATGVPRLDDACIADLRGNGGK